MPGDVLLNDIDEEVFVVPALEKSTVSVPEAERPLRHWSSIENTLNIYLFFISSFISLLFFPKEIQSFS